MKTGYRKTWLLRALLESRDQTLLTLNPHSKCLEINGIHQLITLESLDGQSTLGQVFQVQSRDHNNRSKTPVTLRMMSGRQDP